MAWHQSNTLVNGEQQHWRHVEKRNSSALAKELRLSCANPSMISLGNADWNIGDVR